MMKYVAPLSVVIFILSTVVHFSTYVPAIPISMDYVWPLHLATMGVFGAMVFSLAAEQKRHTPKTTDAGWWSRLRMSNRQNSDFQRWLWSHVSTYLRVFCVATVIYVAINFLVFMVLMENGSPGKRDGKYVLQSHGTLIREITRPEYQRFLAYEVRGASGHWMLFSLAPAVYFLAVYPRLKLSGNDDREETTS